MTEGQGDPQLEAQAFSAPEGQIVGPFKTDRGYYVIEVSKITPETTQPLDQASTAIKQQLVSAKQQQIASDFQIDFTDKWTARTICAEGQEISALQQLRRSRGRAGPGSADPAAGSLHQADRTGHIDDLDRRHRPSGPAAGSAAAGRRRSGDAAPGRRRADRPRRRTDDWNHGAARRDHGRASRHDGRPAAPSAPLRRRAPLRRPPRPDPPFAVADPVSSDSERAAAGADAVARLDEITRRLRRECPWDRAQDERSIVPHTVEEAYELADAAASGDDEKLLDELGDVLFQVHFLSLLLEERGEGDLAAVAENTREKLIRRHPHVFGEVEVAGTDDVRSNWDRIKRDQEGRGAEGPFADVPENLPGLLYARKLQRRAASAGLPGPAGDAGQAAERLEQAVAKLRETPLIGDPEERTDEDRDRIEDAIGSLLLAATDLARVTRVDPELTLRRAADGLRESAE